MKNLIKEINKIKTQKDLEEFLELLKKDYQINKKEWQNLTIPQYLEAIRAFIKDDGIDIHLQNKNRWQLVASLLYIGKIYE